MIIEKPTQAVILCGGRGTRLKPYTDNLPKPMVEVNGRPYLLYLIEQLSDEGITNILLLTGYKKEIISEYFIKLRKPGLNIQFSEGPVDWDTGKRIWEARKMIHENFLLLYSDNYAQFNLNELLTFREKTNLPLTLTVAQKDKGNISLNENLIVDQYDNQRKEQNLHFVEIGYMLVNLKSVLGYFETPEINFSEIISSMVNDKQVSALIKDSGYLSISDPERLELTREYFSSKKILLIDRDGTLNKKYPRGEYVKSWDDFIWMPRVKESLKILASEGFKFIVISNQAGIARNMISADQLNEITMNFQKELSILSVEILQTYICPHHWDDGCECRKPKPGLFFEASKDWLFRLDKALYIGDDARDCQAAKNAGCKCIFLGTEDELKDLDKEELPIAIHANLFDAIPIIKDYYKETQFNDNN